MRCTLRPLFAVTAGILIGTSACAAQTAERDFEVAEAPALDDHFPQQPVLFADGVEAYRDVTYQQLRGFTPQVVDIYLPPTEGPHPLVLYIHGGGWIGGHTRHSGALANFPVVLARLASEGFVVASLEYRLSGEAQYPAQLQDTNAAIRFLRANAEKYRIDTESVGVWGGSAGGHLSALAALTCGNTTLDPQAAQDGCVQAAVIWYGMFDFATQIGSRPAGTDDAAAQLLGCDGVCTEEQMAFASPASFIDANDPPFLLIHGEEDQVVPIAQSHLAEAQMRAAGVDVETIYIPGVDHSFIGQSLEETRAATLRATNATFDFFHARLRPDQR